MPVFIVSSPLAIDICLCAQYNCLHDSHIFYFDTFPLLTVLNCN